ncbi:MAG: molybdenum cofactor cytidylyltransferase, partial [Deltaproteobacteria bacterium]
MKARDFVSALLLAAGESQRMGRLKQLLPLGGSTLIEVVLENLLRSRLQEVIVVLGFGAEEIRPRVEAKGVRVAVNPRYKEGMASSLRVGLDALDPRAEGILVALADQPFIPPEVIDRLIEAFQG